MFGGTRSSLQGSDGFAVSIFHHGVAMAGAHPQRMKIRRVRRKIPSPASLAGEGEGSGHTRLRVGAILRAPGRPSVGLCLELLQVVLLYGAEISLPARGPVAPEQAHSDRRGERQPRSADARLLLLDDDLGREGLA